MIRWEATGMTSRFLVTDDMNGEDLSNDEHFEVVVEFYTAKSATTHYRLLDQAMAYVFKLTAFKRVSINRKNNLTY